MRCSSLLIVSSSVRLSPPRPSLCLNPLSVANHAEHDFGEKRGTVGALSSAALGALAGTEQANVALGEACCAMVSIVA